MKLRSSVLAATAITAALAMTPAAALAQTQPPTRDRTAVRDAMIDRVKTRCLAQIDRRQRAISELNTRLDNRNTLSDDHRAALKQIDDSTSAGLTTLANTIQGETDGTKLRAECRSIVDDYRVFVLVRPRARLVSIGDRELAAVAKLHDVSARIAAKHPDADLTALNADIDAAASHAGAIYDEVNHLTPQSYSAGVLTPGRDDAHAARDSIRAAIDAAHKAVQAVKGSSTSTTA